MRLESKQLSLACVPDLRAGEVPAATQTKDSITKQYSFFPERTNKVALLVISVFGMVKTFVQNPYSNIQKQHMPTRN